MKEQDLSKLEKAIKTVREKEEAQKIFAMETLEKERKRLKNIEKLQRQRYEFLIQPQITEPLLKGAELISEKFPGTCLWVVIPKEENQVPVLQLAVPVRTKSHAVAEVNDIFKNYIDIWPVISSDSLSVMVERWDSAPYNARSILNKIHLSPTEYPVNESLAQIFDDNLAQLYNSISRFSPLDILQLCHWGEDWVFSNSMWKYFASSAYGEILDGAKTILFPSQDSLKKFRYSYNYR